LSSTIAVGYSVDILDTNLGEVLKIAVMWLCMSCHVYYIDICCHSCNCIVGFKEMLDAPNARQLGKKHNKHSTPSMPSAANLASIQFAPPVIASAAPGRTLNHRDDMSPGLVGGQKAAKIRRALAKISLLPLSTSRYCIGSLCGYG